VLSGFGERLAETESSEDLLDRLTRVLAEGTGAERAEVWVKVGDELRRTSAWPRSPEISASLAMQNGTLPVLEASRVAAVTHGGEALGALTITKKRSDPLTPVEDKLVTDLAAQAGLVLRNVGLTQQLRQRLEQLQASRQRLVTAQDEERRRIERNLHDGAQQQLIALQLGLSLAQRRAEADCHVLPALERLKQDADDALTNLRELARGIYPPLLAADGLGVALQAQARKSAVPVELRLDGIGRQRPELEAAVYFCCLEALQNVAKYAQASRAEIMIATTDDRLRFEIADDGKGFDPISAKRSSGLQNMQDRVEVLGGDLSIESAPGAGTRIIGSIPLS
jgi:signal transduction histidine kinase